MIQKYSTLQHNSAGLFNLKGIDIKLSKVIADAIYQAITHKVNYLVEGSHELIRRKLNTTSFLVSKLYYSPEMSLFPKPTQDGIFRAIQINITLRNSVAFAFVPGRKGSSLEIELGLSKISDILINDYKIINNPNKEVIYSAVKHIISHELRHAADYILNLNSLEAAGFQTDSMNYAVKDPTERMKAYFNNPTEMKSYAGSMAEELFQTFNGNIAEFQNTEKLNTLLNNRKCYYYLEPENKKKFLTRVYNEFKRLAETKYPEELVNNSDVFYDQYEKEKIIAKECKDAKEFAHRMVPKYKYLEEKFKEIGSISKMGDYRQEYVYLKKLFTEWKKAYPVLKNGQTPDNNPHSLY